MTQQLTVAAPALGTMPNTGQWGWYKDHEGREYRRVSTLVKKVETDDAGLQKWFQRQVAIGMALRPDLVLAVQAVGREPAAGYSDSQKSVLNKVAKDAMEAAKTKDGGVLGTAIHTLTERADRGEPIEEVVKGLPADPATCVRAYRKLIEMNAWQVISIERSVKTDELGPVVGTLDRVYGILGLISLFGTGECQYGDACPDVGLPGHGDAVIGDVKTEASPDKNGLHIAPQLAIYSRAKSMWLPAADGLPARYVPAPCVRQDVAVVVHVRDGHARPIFVDINRGWVLAQRAYAQVLDESNARRKIGQAGSFFAEMPGIVYPKPVETFVEHAASRQYGKPETGTLATAVLDAARAQDVPATMAALHRAEAATQDVQSVGRPSPGDKLTLDGTELVAVAGSDGMVEWRPAAQVEPPIGVQLTVAGVGFTKIDTIENVVTHGALDTIDKQAIENVWAADGLPALAETFRIYTEIVKRQWGGRVAEAADARRRQIECPQRALHTAGKCACGWTPGVPA